MPFYQTFLCFAEPQTSVFTDPSHVRVTHKGYRVDRIVGPMAVEPIPEQQHNYMSFDQVLEYYGCNYNRAGDFRYTPALTFPYIWSYQTNQTYYWSLSGNAPLTDLGLAGTTVGLKFKRTTSSSEGMKAMYTFYRPQDFATEPQAWWFYRPERGKCDILGGPRVSFTHDKAPGKPYCPAQMPDQAKDEASLDCIVLSDPVTPQPLPAMGIIPTAPPLAIPTGTPPPAPTATPTPPPSGNLPAPDIRGGQLPNSTDWRLYLSNWNDVMTGGRYVTHLTNPPDWQDPDPNASCMTVAITQPSDTEPQIAPEAACWPRSGELDVACGSRLEAKTFNGSGNSSPVGVFTTGSCPPTPPPSAPPGDTGWIECYEGCTPNGSQTHGAAERAVCGPVG